MRALLLFIIYTLSPSRNTLMSHRSNATVLSYTCVYIKFKKIMSFDTFRHITSLSLISARLSNVLCTVFVVVITEILVTRVHRKYRFSLDFHFYVVFFFLTKELQSDISRLDLDTDSKARSTTVSRTQDD